MVWFRWFSLNKLGDFQVPAVNLSRGVFSYSKQFNYLELSEVYHLIGGKLNFPLVGPSNSARGTVEQGDKFLHYFSPGNLWLIFFGSYAVNDDVFSYWEWGAGSGSNFCDDARATVYHCLLAMASA